MVNFEMHDRLNRLDRLEVVLKTIERCNINCTYCYFFNDRDKSYLTHPKSLSLETIQLVADFLCKGVADLKIKEVIIIFHGGEPLLQKKTDFEFMCNIFQSKLSVLTKLSLNVQTNGLLISDTWIELFEKYNIGVGVSIDGPKLYNDEHRLDHKGNGTYDRLKKGVDLLLSAALKNRIRQPGSLTVINPNHSSKLIYQHLVKDLGFTVLDFLFPDFSYESFTNNKLSSYEKYISDLISCRKEDDNPDLYMRIFDSITRKILKRNDESNDSGIVSQIISISTGGHVVPSDLLRNTNFWNSALEVTLHNHTLFELLNSDIFCAVRRAEKTIPELCKNCCWSEVCKGGELINRYSNEKKFNNPSVYCSVLKSLYSEVTGDLLSSGVSQDIIARNLKLQLLN